MLKNVEKKDNQNEMFKGWNNILPLMRRLLEKGNEAQADAFAEYLQGIPPEEKVLRWPAGTGSKSYVFERDLTIRFHDWCKKSGIQYLYLVVNEFDINGFYETYNILSKSFGIVNIEFTNEPYLPSHVRRGIKLWTKEWWLMKLAYPQLLKLRADNLLIEYNVFRDACVEYGINEPISFPVDYPKGFQSSVFFERAKKHTNEFILHIYERKDVAQVLKKLKPYNFHVTENSGIHFGDNLYTDIRNPEKAHTKEFLDLHTAQTNSLEEAGAIAVLDHCFFDIDGVGERNNLYHRFLLKETEIIDRYAEIS